MTASNFAAWVAAMKTTRGWRKQDCAEALGVWPKQVTRWLETGAPSYVALACAAIAADLSAWKAA